MFEGGRLASLRGRLLDFPCPACPIYQPDGKLREGNCRGGDKAKWLGAGGGRTVLFGAETLYPGATVVIAEAPYSAILLRQEHPETVALACMGAAWQDAWTEVVANSRPQSVGVYMDNDPTGQEAGIKIANVLLAKGLRVKRHPWPAGATEGRDLADELLAAIRARQGVPA